MPGGRLLTTILPGQAPTACQGLPGAGIGSRSIRGSPRAATSPAPPRGPRDDHAAGTPGQAPLADAADVKAPLRVVIVDDNRNFRHLLRFALRRNDRFAVVGEGANGHDAIELAQTHRPDLMLLDIKMPGIPGEKALPLVLRASPATRVVVVSGLDPLVMRHDLAALGAAGYVEKDGSLLDIGQGLLALADAG